MKVLDGNPGKRPINHDEPIPPNELGEPPARLTDEQRAVWNEILAELGPGHLRGLDRLLFELLVVATSRWREALEKCKLGQMVRDPLTNRPMNNPWIKHLNEAGEQIARFGAELGFSPTARARVKATRPSGGGKGNAFSGLKTLTDL